jgi:cytochrome c556
MKRLIVQALWLTALLLVVAAHHWTTRASQPEPKRTRAEFMRQKLDFAKDVLEGLSLERFDTIEKGGKALKRLSESAEWEVTTIPAVNDFVMFTTDFQRHADELVKQAKAKNIDGATLAYVKLTMGCVQCHKFIRGAAK